MSISGCKRATVQFITWYDTCITTFFLLISQTTTGLNMFKFIPPRMKSWVRYCHGRLNCQLLHYTRDDNIKRTRGHSWKLATFRCTWDCCEYFFSNRVIIRWNQLDQQTVGASSINAFKRCLNKIKETRMGFFWTDPLSPRPPWLVF